MGYRHSRVDMVGAAVAVAATDGLSRLTYASVAARLAIPDRTVVYYFPTKQHLVTAVMEHVGEQVREWLHAALAGAPATPGDLLDRAWSALQTPQAVAATRIYLDLVALAGSGDAVLGRAASDVALQWLAWIEDRLDAPAAARRDLAHAVLAQLDGLLLLRQMAGTDAADAAARGLGLGLGGDGT